MKKNPLIDRSLLIRNKPLPPGRHLIVTPDNSCMNFLSYGRIFLNEEKQHIEIQTADQEFNFIALKGKIKIQTNGDTYPLDPYDSIYVPRNTTVQLNSENEEADIVECSAPVTQSSAVQLVRFRELKGRHPLHMKVGQEGYARDVYQFVGPQVKAFRLLTGVTFGRPGNWTSFPPHRHEHSREEIYLYIEMPQPGFGVQFIYEDPSRVEFAEMVRENDVVLLPKGYHPNVAAPGFGMNFLWMMAAYQEIKDREWADMEWQTDLRDFYQ